MWGGGGVRIRTVACVIVLRSRGCRLFLLLFQVWFHVDDVASGLDLSEVCWRVDFNVFCLKDKQSTLS